MPRILPRVVDVSLVVLGALLPLWINTSNESYDRTFDGLLVAFAAALALSVFPACGIYRSIQRSSFLRLLVKTLLSWSVVQGGSILLLHLLGRHDVLLSSWFLDWTIASGIALVAVHAMARAAIRFSGSVIRVPVEANSMSYSPSTLASVSHIQAASSRLKRTFDLVVASLLLVILSPVFLLIALLIVRDGGPAIFGHLRVGREGKLFRCLKFRSMVPDADIVLQTLLARDPVARAEWEREHKLKNDVRITAVGQFLRRTSLDELPQLLNVLRGEMSLVGPRPIVTDELARYGQDATYYLAVKPGMTGLWQVSGRNDTDYPTRVSLDVTYIRNWTFLVDLRILLKTVDVVVNGRGAY
ncbi:sugar transferase [Paraburkholderia sp. J7]|uniref:sugar transferase n=1 Tax=Paraburkholderia sp. J7 TaxID=2805438 RepID=UPI002AB600CE|nr:sugar transferase [Paraburkholderia sp. J7]